MSAAEHARNAILKTSGTHHVVELRDLGKWHPYLGCASIHKAAQQLQREGRPKKYGCPMEIAYVHKDFVINLGAGKRDW